jgi:hypothetical protein
MFLTTGIFLLLLSVLYGLAWYAIRMIRNWPPEVEAR